MADQIHGNSADNALDGGAGDDILSGGRGNDTLIGGAGTDTVTHTASAANLKVSYDRSTGELRITDVRALQEGQDLLVGIEQLKLTDRTLSLEADPAQLSALRFARLGLGRDITTAELTVAADRIKTSSALDYATPIVAGLTASKSADLAALTLDRLGLTIQTIRGADPAGSLGALRGALETIFDIYTTPSTRAQVMLNLTGLLSGLTEDSTFGGAAKAFTQQVQGNYVEAVVQAQLIGQPPAAG
jgi:Ca2+-binding RTX toxin-like protein